MNIRSATAILYLLMQLSVNPAPPQQENRKASIEGIVTQVTTGDPLVRAQVTLSRMTPPPAPPAPGQATPTTTTLPPQIPQLFTESDGKFLFKDLEPGQYRLNVRVNGYANQEYGQRVVFGAGTPIALTTGQTMKDIIFKMVPDGTVTGRVRDSKGDPVPGLTVSLFRPIYNAVGSRTLTTSGAGISDDRGEYRAFFIPPGRYYVGIAPTSSAVQVLVLGNNVIADRTFPTTYYPSALDTAHATMIEVQPGMEINGVDILLTLPSTYRIRGKVVDGVTSQAPKSFSIGLSARVDPGAANAADAVAVRYTSTTDPTTGIYEVRNVMPGSYWVRATMSSNLDDPLPANIATAGRSAIDVLDSLLSGNRGTAQIPVDVLNTDLENANITMMPTISVPVQLTLEDLQLSQLGGVDRIRVNLRATNSSSPSSTQRTAFNEEGRSNVENVSPGEYRIQMALGVQPDLYLKDARIGVKQVLSDPFLITSQSSETINITLSNHGGRIDGTLSDAQSKQQAGIQVVLIPDESRDRPELYKNTPTDPSGHFTLRGIPPGNYKLFAWEAIENFSYFDPAVLSKYESQGKQVHIAESSTNTVELKIIPAAKP